MYGVFQTYYSHSIAETSSASAISWIGSVQVFLLGLIGTLVGPIYDSGYCRPLLVLGTLLCVLGMFMTSICRNYWELFLAQGVAVGSGMGCLFLPGVAIVYKYFDTKKAFATGVASLGSSLGGVIYPIVWTQLQPKIGFGWATRVVAFILLTTLIIPLIVTRHYTTLQNADLSGTPTPLRILHTSCSDLLYAMARAHMSPHLGFYLLALINAGSYLGRKLPNFAADYLGTLNIQMTFALASTVLSLSLIAIRNNAGILVFCVLYGFFTGTFVSLPTLTVASLSTNVETLGARLSMAFMAAAVGSLVGSPIAGAILATGGGDNWNMLQLWSGVILFLCSLSMFGARIAKVGMKFKAKA